MKIKIPKGWSNLKLGVFIQLMDLPETGNELNDFINKLSVITGSSSEELKDNITTKDLPKLAEKMAFLSKLPKPKKANWFLWGFKMFKRQPFRLTTTSQIADIMKLNENESNEGQKMLNVISVIYYNGKEEQYSGDRYEKMKEKFYDLPFTHAYNSSVFFLNGLTTYLQSVLMGFSKLKNKMTMNELNELHAKLEKLKDVNGFKKFTNGMTS